MSSPSYRITYFEFVLCLQPSIFQGAIPYYNWRKIRELPFHLMAANSNDELDHMCLFNFEFLRATLLGLGVDALVALCDEADMASGPAAAPPASGGASPAMGTSRRMQSIHIGGSTSADADKKLTTMLGEAVLPRQALREALRYAVPVLQQRPQQLGAQLLGRLLEHSSQIDIKALLEQVESFVRLGATYQAAPLQTCLLAPDRALQGQVDLLATAVSLAPTDPNVASSWTVAVVTASGTLEVRHESGKRDLVCRPADSMFFYFLLNSIVSHRNAA